jgi:hypothetical protein
MGVTFSPPRVTEFADILSFDVLLLKPERSKRYMPVSCGSAAKPPISVLIESRQERFHPVLPASIAARRNLLFRHLLLTLDDTRFGSISSILSIMRQWRTATSLLAGKAGSVKTDRYREPGDRPPTLKRHVFSVHLPLRSRQKTANAGRMPPSRVQSDRSLHRPMARKS